MAVWETIFEIIEDNEESNITEVVKLSSRVDTNLKTIVLKSFEMIAEKHFPDTIDVMDFMRSAHRQAYDWEDLAEDMLTELDIKVNEPSILG